jgi:hypothetical protein
MYLRRPHYLWGLLLPFSGSALPTASPLSMSVCPEDQESPCSETFEGYCPAHHCITTPAHPLKLLVTKKLIEQADSDACARKQKEEGGEPLLAGID